MEFFKVKRFRKAPKQKAENDPDPVDNQSCPEKLNAEDGHTIRKSDAVDHVADMEDEDDFIINEVKRRLKELRKNSFLVIIPEESSAEEDEEEREEEKTSSSEWRESEAVDGSSWCGFDTFYEKYCERMLFFDKMSSQQLQEAGCYNVPNPSLRSAASKKLVSTLRSLSFKKKDEFQDGGEHLQPEQWDGDPFRNLETAYVAQICLTWEALHCQYMQLIQNLSSHFETSNCYNYAVQAFQQFQVLLQRFIENEPFKDGSRVEIYSRTRISLPKLLQVPNFQGLEKKENEDGLEASIHASDLVNIIAESILTFRIFLKADKKKTSGSLLLCGDHNQSMSSLQQVQSSLHKKEIKLKEFFKRKKSWKKKGWPSTLEEVELLFGLIDVKVVSRVLRIRKISKEQLLWCEEKMSKLDVSENRLRRFGSPVLFPC